VANNCTATSTDGVYTVNVIMDKGPDGRYFVELDITTQTSQDTIDVRVNGELAWKGLAAEAAGG
jgi:hypothetical protein